MIRTNVWVVKGDVRVVSKVNIPVFYCYSESSEESNIVPHAPYIDFRFLSPLRFVRNDRKKIEANSE